MESILLLSVSEETSSDTRGFRVLKAYQLRAIRFQDDINRATPRRNLKRITRSKAADSPKSNDSIIRNPDGYQPEPLRVQHHLMDDDETRSLQG